MLEAVEGRPYPDVLRARILDPLDLSATEPAITNAIRSRLAVGYDYLHDDRMGHAGAELAPATWLETETADGSIASTAADMCAFVRVLLGGGRTPTRALLSKSSFDQMTSAHAHDPHGGEYGYGLSIRTLNGRRFVGHGGGMVGYAAAMETDPEAGLGAVVLQNAMNLSSTALARTVIQILRDVRDGTPQQSETATRAVAASASDTLAGVYDSDEPGCEPIEIVGHDGVKLRVGGREVALEALEDDLFLVPDAILDRFPIRVERAVSGFPELWHGSHRYVRASAPSRRLPEPRAELRSIVGHYRSHNPWTTNFRVLLRGARPWLLFASAPDGFATEQEIEPRADGSFRVGDDPANPESLCFDTTVAGRALRAWLSGWPYYRAD